MFCTHCGNSVSVSDRFCTKCGTTVSMPDANPPSVINTNNKRNPNLIYPSKGMISPGVAALISVFIQGLGQMLLGQVGKGFVILGSVIFICFFGTLITCGYGAIILVPVCIIIPAIDAYKIAHKLHNDRPVGKWEFF